MRVGTKFVLVGVALVVGTLSLGHVGRADPAPSPAAPDAYRLVIGDTLSVVVEGEETFTRECQVNGAGAISYPKLGDVSAAGLTCEEVRAHLEEGLKTYLKHPSVILTVHQYGQSGMSVFVMGEVMKPGPYPLTNGAGYMQALAAAGGLTEAASGEITVLKGRTRQATTLLITDTGASGAASSVILEPGDVLLALRKREARYAVLGEVNKPGMYDMPTRWRSAGAGRGGEGGGSPRSGGRSGEGSPGDSEQPHPERGSGTCPPHPGGKPSPSTSWLSCAGIPLKTWRFNPETSSPFPADL